MFWYLRLGALLLAAGSLLGQAPPSSVAYTCTQDDIQWAGMSCSEEEPCPIFLELVDVGSVGNRIFIAGNLHTDTTTLYSILLASEDAGATWKEGFERMRGVGLDHIQFIDFENGWINGGTLQPLPQDPFLLITNDGGKNWRKKQLFDDVHSGAIQQFYFSSKKDGSLVLERSGETGRYALFESPNGGETWMVREVGDKPPQIRRPNAAPSAWRLRADAKLNAFVVERQAGEDWSRVAAFLVSAGKCKPPSMTEPPPPQESEKPATTPPAPAPPRPPPSLRKPPQ